MGLIQTMDYANKRIYLSVETTDVVVDTLDVYKEARALRVTTEAHRNFKPMIVAGGNVEKIPGQTYTQPYVQLLYGCRIVPYNASHQITINRDTFTDDGFAGRDCFDRTPLSPTVEVDIDFQVDKVEVRLVSNGNDPAAIATAVWAEASALALMADVALIGEMTGGRWQLVNNQMIFYASDNLTEIARFNLFDVNGNPTLKEPYDRVRV